jgi:hypothetical protein
MEYMVNSLRKYAILYWNIHICSDNIYGMELQLISCNPVLVDLSYCKVLPMLTFRSMGALILLTYLVRI